MPGFIQRAAQARNNHPAHQPRVAKSDLRLGGVDVHINKLGRHIQKQRHHRMAIARQQILISTAQRAHQQAIAHRPLIYKQILVIGNAPIPCRDAGQTGQMQAFTLQIDRHGIAGKIRADDRRKPRQRRPRRRIGQRRQVQQAAAIMFDHKTHLRPRHGQPADMIKAGRKLRPRRFQELAPGRDVSEQAVDARHSPRRRAGRAVVNDAAIVHHQPPPLAAFEPAGQRQPGDRADGRQRLPAKSHGLNGLQIFVRQFRRGVAFNGEPQLIGCHAEPIVSHFQTVDAAVHQDDADAPRAGVQCVFNKFLGRTRRTFNHLTGSDPVDQGFRQATNGHSVF